MYLVWSDFDRASSLICGNKMPTRCNRWFLLQSLLLAQHVSGHHYAHHQELESVIQKVAACGICCSSPQTGHTTLSSTPYRQLENQAPNTTGSNHLYNTFKLLMMGIMVPETCWASNKICDKNSSVAFYFHIWQCLLSLNSVNATSLLSSNCNPYRLILPKGFNLQFGCMVKVINDKYKHALSDVFLC